MLKVAHACAAQMVEKQCIAVKEYEVYRYGLEVLFSTGGVVLAAVVVGKLMGFLLETLVFLLAFIPIRWCIGGYHARTPERCVLLSCATIILGIGIGLQTYPTWLLPLVVGVSLGLVFWLAPVVHPNNPYSQEQRVLLRKRARRMGILEGGIVLMVQCFRPELAAVMAIAYLTASLGMMATIGCDQVEA